MLYYRVAGNKEFAVGHVIMRYRPSGLIFMEYLEFMSLSET